MPPAIVARILETEPVREQPNKYGPGVTPAWDAHGKVTRITFDDSFTRELAEKWLEEHEYKDPVISTRRSLSIQIPSGRSMERLPSGGLLVRDVPILMEGTWTDSMQKTPWKLTPEFLERFSSNWQDDALWIRHPGGQPRSALDRVGKVVEHRFGEITLADGTVKKGTIGNILIDGIGDVSRNAADRVEAGEIGFVSAETIGADKWNVGARVYEPVDLAYTGLALVHRGACKICQIPRANEDGSTMERENAEVKQSDSLEEKQRKISIALGEKLGLKFPDGTPRSPWVRFTLPDQVVYEGEEDRQYFRIPYMVDGESITFGEPVPVEMVYKDKELSEMTPEEIATIKEEIKKELSAENDGKVKELSDKLTAAENRIKELETAPAPAVTAPDAGARELAQPTGYRIIIGPDGEVGPAEV